MENHLKIPPSMVRNPLSIAFYAIAPVKLRRHHYVRCDDRPMGELKLS